MRRSIAFFSVWLASVGLVHAVNPALPNIPTTIFNVTDYGAIGNGVKDNTTNIQNTINAASAAGGGIVEIPAGTFLSGPITLLSSVNLQVDTNGMLQMLPLGTYPGGTTGAQTFIGCNTVHDVEISGWGKIDGQGAAWWTYFSTNTAIVRPMMLNLYSANRLFIHDITFQNPPYHHCGLRSNGGNITISNLTINTLYALPTGIHAYNTDGLNFVATNSIIENCHITDGDDDIAMGSTGPLDGLLVTNCTFGAGHGVSIGSGVSVGVSNLTVINSTFNATDYGIRMKSDTNSGGIAQNLNYLNLGMTNLKYGAITIYSYYNESGTPTGITPTTAAGETISPVNNTTPVWRNITFSNLTATVSNGGVAGIIWGRTELPATNIVMNHVNITASKTFDIYNAQKIQFLDSIINTGSDKTFTIWNANVIVSNTVLPTNVVTFDGLGGNTNDSFALYNVRAAMTSTDAFGANPITLSGSVLTNTGNLTFSSKKVINFALGTSNTAIAVAGDLNLNATLNITNAAGFAATNYTLFSYTSTLSGQPTLGATPAGFASYTYRLDTNTVGQVKLVVAAPSPPNFQNIQIANGGGGGSFSFVISGTGGVTNGTYYVLASTNLALPLNQWMPVTTNQFDAGGNFIFTNSAPTNAAQEFFRLQLP
jgi:polygalacturonase